MKQIADRHRHLVRHDDEHDRWRNEDAKRTGRGNDARGKALVVALLEHDRHGQHGQKHDRGADDAGRGGQKDPDQHDTQREPAAESPEELDEVRHQLFRHARSLKHEAHEDEHRQGHEDPVRHLTPDALHHHPEDPCVGEEVGVPAQVFVAEDGDEAEDDRDAGKRPGDRKAGEDQPDEADQERDHKEFVGIQHVGAVSSCAGRSGGSCQGEFAAARQDTGRGRG
jgi:hypothetical protein